MVTKGVKHILHIAIIQDATTPYPDIRAVNFSGCIEEVFLGPDLVELSANKDGAHGVEAGCTAKVKTHFTSSIHFRTNYML